MHPKDKENAGECNSNKAFNSKNNRVNLFSQNLPIFNVKQDLLHKLKTCDTSIILGETGCGKTTQIPKYILENNINRNGLIVVTQPRRLATLTIAHRVAAELNEVCGETVGYKVRFKNETGSRTKLIYATDGTLLREAIHDQLFLNYNVVILDEAHERTVTTDVLFGIVQSAQEIRKNRNLQPLKIIIMSAALDVDHFHSYFKNAPVFHVKGRHHKVDIFHTAEDIEDYYFTCLVTVFNIHLEFPPDEDILVFLTGQEEIEKMAKDIQLISKNPECTGPGLRVHTLYAAADPKCQLDIFTPTSSGTRKIIISTNIAETSITIPGIRHVVDSGKVKMKYHNPVTGVNILKVCTISQEQALQRAGRAGRESDGSCFRAYSSKQFDEMRKSTLPEIHRCNLCSVVLTLLAMKKDPRTFNFIDQPEESAIKESLEELRDLGAVADITCSSLTSLGNKMSFLPLDPKYSKILISASEFNCMDEILDIIAMLTTDNVFITPASSETEVQEIKQKFYSSLGDHVTLLNVFKNFNSVKCKQEWCKNNYISFRAMDFAKQIKIQLISLCGIFRMQITSCGQDLDKVRKCLITGLFKNIAVLQQDRSYITIISKQRAFIHPSSVLHKSLPHCILYTELQESTELYIKNVSVIDIDWLPQLIPNYVDKKNAYIISEPSVSRSMPVFKFS